MTEKFNVIYADCPWSYKDKALAGKRGAICKYDVMSTNDIKNLPIKDIAADDCALFFWVTMPKLQDALDVIKAWGFTFKTNAFTWIKLYPKSRKKFFMGMGRWTRANSEICLLATKGKPKRISASVHSVVMTRHNEVVFSPIQIHSKKPEIIRHKIVELCGDVPRVELFARNTADGWVSWGNQIDGRTIEEIINKE